MPDPLTDAEDYPYGKIDASGQPMEVNDVPLPDAPDHQPGDEHHADASSDKEDAARPGEE